MTRLAALAVSSVLGYSALAASPDWYNPQIQPAPSARCCMSFAYDPLTRSAVLFGGENLSVWSGDTWVWKNGAWTRRFPPNSPSARQGAGMAFDASTGNVVLFGGSNGRVDLNDTWIWNGVTWTEQFPPIAPSPRAFDIQSMVYDGATGTIVLFGGYDYAGDFLSDTWEWNGQTNTWTLRFPASSPSHRWTTLAYDSFRRQVVLFGGSTGQGDCCSVYYNDTWTWDGTTWKQHFPRASPPPRTDAMMAFDPNLNQVVLFGGFSTPGIGLDDTWLWNGATWTQLFPGTHPGGLWAAAIAFDPLTNALVMFGGEVSGDPFTDQTWLFR